MFDQRGHVAKLCIVFLPLLVAALVGVSRVDDYWHHWQDVFGGAIIGLFYFLNSCAQTLRGERNKTNGGDTSYFFHISCNVQD